MKILLYVEGHSGKWQEEVCLSDDLISATEQTSTYLET